MPLRTTLRPLLSAVAAAFSAGSVAVPTRARREYVGNRKTNRYHRGDCLYARVPLFQHEVETRAGAISAGYFPCGICRPDLSS